MKTYKGKHYSEFTKAELEEYCKDNNLKSEGYTLKNIKRIVADHIIDKNIELSLNKIS